MQRGFTEMSAFLVTSVPLLRLSGLLQQDSQANQEVCCWRRGGERDHLQDHQRRWEERWGDEIPEVRGCLQNSPSVHKLNLHQTHVLSASPSFGSVSSVFIPTNEVHGLSRPRLRVKSAHWWVAATQTISGILLFWALAPWDCELRKYPNSYGCSLRLHTVCGLGEKSLWSEIRSAVLIVGILAV